MIIPNTLRAGISVASLFAATNFADARLNRAPSKKFTKMDRVLINFPHLSSEASSRHPLSKIYDSIFGASSESSFSGVGTQQEIKFHRLNEDPDDDDLAMFYWQPRGQSLTCEDPRSLFGLPFGTTIATSADGNWLAAGWFDMGVFQNGASVTAHVRVYRYVDDLHSWIQAGEEITSSLGPISATISQQGAMSLDFGVLPPMSGDPMVIPVVAIGIAGFGGDSDDNLSYHGKVTVYSMSWYQGGGRQGVMWWPMGGEITDSRSGGGAFGFSVSLSEDCQRLAVGAPYLFPGGDPGYATVFEYKSDDDEFIYSWTQLGDPISGSSSTFGTSVSVNRDASIIAVAGMAFLDFGDNPSDIDVIEPSSILVFKISHKKGEVRWNQVGADLVAESNKKGDYMIVSVGAFAMSADGSTIVSGGRFQVNMPDPYEPNPDKPQDPIYVGHIRVYEFDVKKGEYSQKGNDVDADLTDPSVGMGVAVNNNGTMIAYSGIFTPEEAKRRSKDADDDNGSFELFQPGSYVVVVEPSKNIEGHWQAVGIPLQTENSMQSYLGTALAFSSNYTMLAMNEMGSQSSVLSYFFKDPRQNWASDTMEHVVVDA